MPVLYLTTKSETEKGKEILETVKRQIEDLFVVNAYNSDDGKNIFISDDYSLSSCFVCKPLLNSSNFQVEEFFPIVESIQSASDYLVQYVLFKSEDVSSLRDLRVFPAGSIQEMLISSSNDMLAAENNFDLIMLATIKVKIDSVLPDEHQFNDFHKLQNAFKEKLVAHNLQPVNVTPESYIGIIDSILSTKDNLDKISYNEGELISHQFIPAESHIIVSNGPLKINDNYISVLSSRRVPQTGYFGDAINYCGDIWSAASAFKNKLLVTVNILYPANVSRDEVLDALNEEYSEQAQETQLLYNVKNPGDAHEVQSTDNATSILAPDDHSKYSVSISLAIFGSSENQLLSDVKAHVTRLNQVDLRFMIDTFMQLPVFLNMLPMNTDMELVSTNMRYRNFDGQTIIKCLPIFSEYKKADRAGVVVNSRTGIVSRVAMAKPGINSAIFCDSDSINYSIFSKNIALNLFASGVKVITFSQTNEFGFINKLLDGKRVSVNPKVGVLTVDPFQMLNDSTLQIFEQDVVNLAFQLIDNDSWMKDSQKAVIKSGLQSMLRENARAQDLFSILDLFRKSKSKFLQRCAGKLQQLVDEYGQHFTPLNASELDLHSDFISIDCQSIGRSSPATAIIDKLIFTRIILEVIRNKVYYEHNRATIAVFDRTTVRFLNSIFLGDGKDLLTLLNESGIQYVIPISPDYDDVDLFDRVSATNHVSIATPMSMDSILTLAKHGSFTRSDVLYLKSLTALNDGIEVFVSDDGGKGVFQLRCNGETARMLTNHQPLQSAISVLLSSGISLRQALKSAEAIEIIPAVDDFHTSMARIA